MSDPFVAVDELGTVFVLDAGFSAVKEKEVWSSSGSTPITGEVLAESFTRVAEPEASDLAKEAREALSS